MIEISNLKNHPQLLPQTPGVYFFSNQEGQILYIGKAKNLRNRVRSYFLVDLLPRTQAMVTKAANLDFIRVDSEFEALLLEASLINKYQPLYNVISRDDKSPLYIIITTEKFPRVRTTRRKEIDSWEKSHKPPAIYGPFPSGLSARSLLRRLRKIFPFCESKSDVGRPCLHSHIGLCNPCPREITNNPTPAKVMAYKRNISLLKGVLGGKTKQVSKILIKEMNSAAENQDFEKAREIRDQIKKLEFLVSPRINVEEYLTNPNLVDDKAQSAIVSLQKHLHLPTVPVRIECYDVANLGKSEVTASMVVAHNGLLDTSLYRHFKIKRKDLPNDVGAIAEVISRRLNHPEWGMPNLIIVDGGKAQLGAAQKVVIDKQISLPVISLAKKIEEIYLPTQDSPLVLSLQDPGLRLLMNLRDEAHRFSRRLHHKLRSRSIFK